VGGSEGEGRENLLTRMPGAGCRGPVVLVIGGGHSGLNLAARLKSLWIKLQGSGIVGGIGMNRCLSMGQCVIMRVFSMSWLFVVRLLMVAFVIDDN
jgi:hypothetical protein